MQTRVWLMRHAETATPKVFHGAESDVGLSERGRRQAQAAAAVLAAQRPEVVIASGMRRAIDTAAPIAHACGLPLRIEPWLHERRVGILGGQPHTPEHPLWGETVRRWMAGDTAFTTPGAESFDDMSARLLPGWNRLIAAHAGRTLLVVAHGMVCKVLMLSLLDGWTVQRWREFGPVPNLGVSELHHAEGTWRGVTLNIVPEAVFAAG